MKTFNTCTGEVQVLASCCTVCYVLYQPVLCAWWNSKATLL